MINKIMNTFTYKKYVHTYIQLLQYIHNIHAYIHTQLNTYILNIYMYTYIHTVHTYIHTCTSLHTCTYIHTYICTYVDMQIRMYIYTYNHTYMQLHTYIHIHTYINSHIIPAVTLYNSNIIGNIMSHTYSVLADQNSFRYLDHDK